MKNMLWILSLTGLLAWGLWSARSLSTAPEPEEQSVEVSSSAQAPSSSGVQGTAERRGAPTPAADWVDVREGKTYPTMRVAGKTWMIRNLDLALDGSVCYDGGNKCTGRLYTWAAARKACPAPWRLPTAADWQMLAAAWPGSAWLGQDGLSGYRTLAREKYGLGQNGYFWTADPAGPELAVFANIPKNKAPITENAPVGRAYGVRCIQD